MTKVLIFGSGISGLTIAHELIKQKFDVTIIEKDTTIGGMAKTRWESNNTPSEHSWRGWGNFYSNTFRVMKEIPTMNDPGKQSVYENLTKEVDFYLVKDDIYKYKRGYSISDYSVLVKNCVDYFLSDKRKSDFYKLTASQYYKDKLSDEGYEHLIKFVQTAGYGMENKDGSVGHLLRFLVLPMTHPFKYKNCHDNEDGKYCSNSTDNWHLLNQPTNDGWFNPWKRYLESQGVKFRLNTELVSIDIKDDTVQSVKVRNTKNDKTDILKADDYILAINPFNLENILKDSIPESDLYKKFNKMNEKTISNQISFRIGINKDIKYPTDSIGIVLTDSAYNITFYPQNKHWKNFDKMNIPFKTLWSGTLMDSVSKGDVFNKPSIKLTKEELSEEIIHQILKSKSFQKLVYDSNGFVINTDDIDYIEIWYEWNFDEDGKKLVQDYKKWVNNIHNEQHRPTQVTTYKNLFLSGAHTKTSAVIYSMEGATESGILTSNLVLGKYNLPRASIVNHNDPLWAEPLKQIDNLLYSSNGPSVFTILIIILLVFIYIKILKKIKKN